ncbi:DNA-processing protein DprA [Thiolapillus sp.]|uniref:DNA-processing protein DprA n=6 Tax=Thiolapillus sp. TaxID=2017437 RepID=UPI0025FA4A33|nr:DNA-processing protein DprA [Thiolapillus sp.]
MSVSPNTQAILLLTAHFAKARKDAVKPLTPKEWGRFALWLKEKSLTPEQLMNGRLGELLNGWSDKTVTLERIEGLMDRGSALALAMEKWLRAGLWVMTRSDPDYPIRLKQRLRTDSPAVLFGCGNRALLNGGGLAVVGSRNATEQDLAYSRDLGALAAGNGYSIVSGGARGVDEAAMLGALEAEGTVIGVLANNLLRACSSARYRKYLMANNLVLISTFYPEAGFNAGNAMQRNKYIYCLSDAAMVVHSGEKGGTWNGAFENIRKQWTPLWVKRSSDPKAGNAAIVRAGALWAPDSVDEIDFASLFSVAPIVEEAGEDLFSRAANEVNEGSIGHAYGQTEESVSTSETAIETGSKQDMDTETDDADAGQPEQSRVNSRPTDDLDFYDLFLIKVASLCSDVPKKPDELVEALNLNKTQLNAWLKHAVSEEKLKKLTRPVRYQWVTTRQSDLPL